MKKAFSLLELIFVIAIISIVAAFALPKFGKSKENVNLMKIKSDIFLIRNGIKKTADSMVLKAEDISIEQLEENNTELFSNVLKKPIISLDEPIAGNWIKVSSSTYKVYIDNSSSLEFKYNKDDLTFDCDLNDNYCKELTQ